MNCVKTRSWALRRTSSPSLRRCPSAARTPTGSSTPSTKCWRKWVPVEARKSRQTGSGSSATPPPTKAPPITREWISRDAGEWINELNPPWIVQARTQYQALDGLFTTSILIHPQCANRGKKVELLIFDLLWVFVEISVFADFSGFFYHCLLDLIFTIDLVNQNHWRHDSCHLGPGSDEGNEGQHE